MDIQSRIENYLNDEELDIAEGLEDKDIDDADLMTRMFEFIEGLNSETLTEEQIEEACSIVDELSIYGEDEELNEAVPSSKRVKIDPKVRRQRRREYRKKRAQLKRQAKRFRKTAKFKKWKRLAKRKAKQGRTATGKRRVTFIGGRR
jgi:hypothetical protein